MFDLPPPFPTDFLESFSSLKSGYDRNSQILWAVFFSDFSESCVSTSLLWAIRRQITELKQAMPGGQVVSKADPFWKKTEFSPKGNTIMAKVEKYVVRHFRKPSLVLGRHIDIDIFFGVYIHLVSLFDAPSDRRGWPFPICKTIDHGS